MKKYSLFIFCNLSFLLYLFFLLVGIDRFLLNFFVNLLIFIIPGLSWISIFKKEIKDPILFLFITLSLSTIILFLGWLIHLMFNIQQIAFTNFIFLIFITNIGLIFSKKIKVFNFLIYNWKSFWYPIIFSLFIYIFISWGTMVVPSFRDYDWELPSPSYSLMAGIKSYSTVNFLKDNFSLHHPLLRNFYSGYAMIMTNTAEKTFFFYETIIGFALDEFDEISFNLLRKIKENKPIILKDPYGNEVRLDINMIDNTRFKVKAELPSGQEMVFELRNNPKIPKFLYYFSPWDERNYLLNVRIINPFLCTLIFLILYYLLYNLTSSFIISLLGASFNFCFPVVFIEYSVGSRTSISVLFILFMVYFYTLREENDSFIRESLYTPTAQFTSGVLAALSDQKTIILPIAIIAKEIFFFKFKNKQINLCSLVSKRGRNIIFGFLFGMFIWWIYGFSIDPIQFINEYFREHFFDRIFHLRGTIHSYCSFKSLWLSFFKQINFSLFMIPTTILFLKEKVREYAGIIFFWFLVGAIAFSLVDYKQIQHLVLIVPALIISSLNFITIQKKILRSILIFLVLLLIFYNIYYIFKISSDFTILKLPAGW